MQFVLSMYYLLSIDRVSIVVNFKLYELYIKHIL